MTRKLPADLPSPELRGGIRPDVEKAPPRKNLGLFKRDEGDDL